MAIEKNSFEIVKLLIKHRYININKKNSFAETPLILRLFINFSD